MTIPIGLIVFDIAAVISMIIVAYLSRRLGEALKVKPFYRILYVTAAIIVVVSIAEFFLNNAHVMVPPLITSGIRFAAAFFGFAVGLRYWSWLFSEYFRK
jgi:chromate transport protein ChrA